jgi:membrane glycosyltransferase
MFYRRVLSIIACMLLAAVALSLFTDVVLSDGFDWLDLIRITLLSLSTLWLSWGAMLAVNGLFRVGEVRADGERPRAINPDHLTAILVPVYNENPPATFSRVAAMIRSLERTGHANFHVAILSDTRDASVAADEERWFLRLIEETGGEGRLFYRRREQNSGKKAGNVADFVRVSGAAYEYMVILDADSLMEGETIVEMVRRMEADPQIGLLQSLPKVIHARSWFGRAIQFSASYFSPVFAGGVAALQGREGPFWGHNAIVRTRAFAQSCGLPELPGKPPFGGHILSHDYVEAALLARAGWTVRVDPDLEGSYEEGPENIIDYAKRDRRWCQGNLQHGMLVAARGLKGWSRFVFLQGIMAYVASPIWLLFLVSSIMAPVVAPAPDYFPEPYLLSPVFPHVEAAKAFALLTGVFGLLVMPKLLIVLRGIATGDNRSFGGTLRAFVSTLVEVLWSSLIAPLMLMYQSRSVLQVLLGADGGWPASDRDDGRVTVADAWAASWWIVVTGLLALASSIMFAPAVLIWLLPIALPMVAAPVLIAVSSRPRAGLGAARAGLFTTPAEIQPSPVIVEREAILKRWLIKQTGPDAHERERVADSDIAVPIRP